MNIFLTFIFLLLFPNLPTVLTNHAWKRNYDFTINNGKFLPTFFPLYINKVFIFLWILSPEVLIYAKNFTLVSCLHDLHRPGEISILIRLYVNGFKKEKKI